MDLDAIAGALPVQERQTVEIDISPWIGQEPGTSVLTLREPDAAAMFRANEDAKIVQVRHAKWPETLCQSVALLALSHVAPVGETAPGQFYCTLCDRAPAVFLRVLQRFQQVFPALGDWDAQVAEGKAG